jgi:hypothetical protein
MSGGSGRSDCGSVSGAGGVSGSDDICFILCCLPSFLYVFAFAPRVPYPSCLGRLWHEHEEGVASILEAQSKRHRAERIWKRARATIAPKADDGRLTRCSWSTTKGPFLYSLPGTLHQQSICARSGITTAYTNQRIVIDDGEEL